jgi:SAM-dependent methyltransferase
VNRVTHSAETAYPNFQIYNSGAVASYYAGLDYFSPCETVLFHTSQKPGSPILDLGVGGARTTPYLSRLAQRYVELDYAPEMVALCRSKFRQLDFVVADESRLAAFADDSFDVVITPFNGIDDLLPDQAKFCALDEMRRVDGVLIFSSVNPRAIPERLEWNSKQIDEITKRLVDNAFVRGAARTCLLGMRVIAAVTKSAAVSFVRALSRLGRQALSRKEGCMIDPAHGGLLTHYAVSPRVIAELEQYGFRLLGFEGDPYPRGYALVNDWYYIVFAKVRASASSTCA